MARYFGHRPAWARPKPASGFGMSEGGPVAPRPNPNPYNQSRPMGREGQIIPPNRGQYPRGKSLPGWAGADRARRAAAASKLLPMAMRGNLATRAFMEVLEFFATSQTTSFDPDADPLGLLDASASIPGYDLICSKPFQNCFGVPDPGIIPWRFGTSGSTAFFCALGLNCNNWPIHQTWADVEALPVAPPGLQYGQDYGFQQNMRRGWLRQSGSTEPWPQNPTRTQTRTLFLPNTLAPPKAEASEKTYPRNRPAPKTDMIFGPATPSGVKAPPRPHQPPLPGEREKKAIILGGRAARAYGMLTEFRDFADCLANNIPGKPCSGLRGNLHEYAACIARHEKSIDMPSAIACFFTSQGRDSAHRFPKIFGNPDPRYYKRPVGPSSGFWSQPSAPSMTPI